MLKTLIVDDHPLLRESVRRALEADGGFEVVGEAATESEFFSEIERTQPDLVLLDLGLEAPSTGFRCLERLQSRTPPVKTVVFSGFEDHELVREALQLGAIGYIVKTSNGEDLAESLRAIVRGDSYVPVRKTLAPVHLTQREAEIIAALRGGLSNKEISSEFSIARRTVKFHLANIYRKLGVTNRTQAASWAQRRGVESTDRTPPLPPA